MFSDYRTIMFPEYRTFFLISLIIRYNNNRDFPSALSSNSKSLLDILIFDFFVVAVDSNISYRNNILVFLAVIITSRSSFYLILYSCYYFFSPNPRFFSI